MKTLKQLLEKAPQGYEPKPKDEKRFVDKHVVAKTADANGNKDDVFNATNVKAVDRNKEGHGYNPGDDEAVYEETIAEKTLTGPEKKKREEVARAIQRENPSMNKSKKMAIATATAKRVAEDVEQSEEQLQEGDVAHSQYLHYHSEAKKMLDKISKGLDTHHKNITSKHNYNGGVPHWGHVGDMKDYHRQIQDLHDRVLQAGEYAAPAVKKEDVDRTSGETLSEEEYDRIRDLYGKSAARRMAYSQFSTSRNKSSYSRPASSTSSSASSSSDKHYHKVPFAKKDEAKKEGMRWDSTAKKWYHTTSAASSSSKFQKESVELDQENQIVDFINSFYEQLDSDNQRVFEELVAEQDVGEILSLIDDVLSEEDNG